MLRKISPLLLSLSLAGCAATSDGNDKSKNQSFLNDALPSSSMALFVSNLALKESFDEVRIRSKFNDFIVYTTEGINNWHKLEQYQTSNLKSAAETSCIAEGGNLVEGDSSTSYGSLVERNIISIQQYGVEYSRLKDIGRPIENSEANIVEQMKRLETPLEVSDLSNGAAPLIASKVWQERARSYYCIKNQKIDSVLVTGPMRFFDDKEEYLGGKPSFSFLTGDSINSHIDDQMEWRLRRLKEHDEKMEAKIAAKARKQEEYNQSMNLHRAVWNERTTFDYKVGDSVCTYNNYRGFIEDINENNFKLLLVNQVVGSNGKFFGYWDYSKFRLGRKYVIDYKSINKVTWLKRGEFAPCPIDMSNI